MSDLTRLNKQQREAVLHDSGPLLVIAGAGTGKTTVLTSRIVRLVLDAKAAPTEILALTFTEKATVEMQERVDMSLPIGYEEMWIKTFHGFCDAVLRERGLQIGLDTGYRILSDAEQWIFLKKHLFEFDFDYFRPLGNPTKFIGALIQHFGRLRDEDITPESYRKAETMERKADADQETCRMAELASAYEKYQELKILENVMDYADLHYYTLRLFEKRPGVLKEYQRRFKYILVDEFQDTNYAQNKIVEMLAREHRNIMVVGDDDQAIYKWRGASLTNIMHFETLFPKAKKIVLTENYRSRQDILDAAYHLIRNNNPDRLEIREKISKRLVSNPGLKNSKVKKNEHGIEGAGFPHYAQEIDFVVGEAERALDAEKSVAVLVRAGAHAEPFLEEFKRRGIPYHFSGGAGLFMREEIRDLIALLKFLSNPTDDIALFRLVTLPIWNFRMELILERVANARHHRISLFRALKNTVTFSGFTGLFDDLIEFSKRQSVSRVIQNFFDKTGYFQRLISEVTAENHEKILNISEFSRKVRDFENEDETCSVLHFSSYLDSLREAGENPRAETLDADSSAVQIMTVHAAKGLEFDVVFLVNLVNGRFPTVNRKDPIEIPEHLIRETLPETDQHIAEERRLFYVGCTRAKEKLFLSYSATYEGLKKWKISVFVEEIADSGKVFRRTADFGPDASLSDAPVSGKAHPHMALGTFTPKKLSYSQLETWQTCPLKYQYRYIYRLPSPSPHAANFGASVHSALNEFYQALKVGGKPGLSLLHELYEKNWIPYGYESKAHEQTRKKHGREILKRFYDSQDSDWVIPKYLERPFSLKIPVPALKGAVTVAGRIDRIDKLPDGTYEVIDYKTGSLRKKSEIDKDVQLSIYAKACEEVFKLRVSKLSFYFLEDNQKISTQRSPAQLAAIAESIAGDCEHMSVSDFAPTPGFHCNFCEYCLLCPKCQKSM